MNEFTLDNGFEICGRTGNFTMGCFGDTYFITNRAGKVLHKGKRKHIVETWNTRYNHNCWRYHSFKTYQLIEELLSFYH
jgi:hypothetical protein